MTPPSPPLPREPPLRVLVADDDAAFRNVLEVALAAAAGIELVGSAGDGLEAVRLYEERRPDVVLMDVVMPHCDGIEATKRIIAIDPSARVIALTGVEPHRMLTLCLAAGAKGALRKDPDTVALAPLMLALALADRATPSKMRPRTSSRARPRSSAAAASSCSATYPGTTPVACTRPSA
jgi:DNA-binding NarL/FixJ family response regulator